MTIVAGSAVGILGVEGWGGFAVYIISQALVSSTAPTNSSNQRPASMPLHMGGDTAMTGQGGD